MRTQASWSAAAPGRAGEAEVRQAYPADREAVRDFLAALSLRSRYQRFFTGAPPSAALLSMLAANRDGTDVVVASDAPDAAGHRRIIGHAMAVDSGPAGARRTEIGVVVADARQGQGVGSALIRAVIDRARARGARSVEMDVLAENSSVLAMVAGHWPEAHYERRAAYVTVRAKLPQQEEERPGAGHFSGSGCDRRPRRRGAAAVVPVGGPVGLGGRGS